MYDETKYHPYLKRLPKGNAVDNYRFITCLPIMWKILTAQIRKDIYYLQISY